MNGNLGSTNTYNHTNSSNHKQTIHEDEDTTINVVGQNAYVHKENSH